MVDALHWVKMGLRRGIVFVTSYIYIIPVIKHKVYVSISHALLPPNIVITRKYSLYLKISNWITTECEWKIFTRAQAAVIYMHDYTNSCKDSCPGTWKVTQCRKTDDLTVCANKTNPLFRQQMKQYNYIKCNYGTRGRTLGGCLGGCETPPALQNRKKSVHI